MFPTTTKNPFPYSTETTTTTTQLKKPFPWDDNNNHHQNPSYAQEVLEPPFFLHFPSPFLDNQEMPLSQIFSQETAPIKNNSSPTTKSNKGSANKKKKNIIIGSTSRRKTGKKDRHSKICTAQGVRDRRMRLSLQIARKFFDLQDMLGFDKASSTIDWLLSQSKTAINELTLTSAPNNNNGGPTSTEECEVTMSIMDIDDENSKDKNLKKKKESREKARARAKERTKEKMMRIKTNNNPFLDQENRTTSSSHDVGITEKYLGAASSTVASSIFQYRDDDPIDPNSNIFMGFVGNNWELPPLISGNPSGSSSLYLDQQNNF